MAIDARLAVSAGLAAWGFAATALARAAERRLGARTLPAAWLEIGLVVALAVGAPVCSATLGDGIARGSVCVALCAAARSDARTGYLFDAITFPTALAAALAEITFGDAAQAANGVLLVVAIFGPIALLSDGNWMGLGDVKALYAIGAAFGPLGTGLALFAASSSGIAAALRPKGTARPRGVPFGPHLALGASLALVLGSRLHELSSEARDDERNAAPRRFAAARSRHRRRGRLARCDRRRRRCRHGPRVGNAAAAARIRPGPRPEDRGGGPIDRPRLHDA